MPDWIALIISFVEKYVIPLTLGLVAFFVSYFIFGDWKEFQRPEIFWLILLLCLAVALSVFVIVEKITKTIINAITNAKNEREYRQWKQLKAQKEWEDEVVNALKFLPGPTKHEIKNCQSEETRFCLYGYEPTLGRLHELNAVTIVGRSSFGLIFVLTKQGMQVVRKRSRDLY